MRNSAKVACVVTLLGMSRLAVAADTGPTGPQGIQGPIGPTGLANSVETKVKIAFANGRNGATKARSGPAHGPGYSSRRNMR